ncbi:class I SAM-dependent methyltransferase [Rhizophagus clarus]|uniref:Class I SAM-dependent methyltransferase n=1 Tax=Rhizophagus clarus TaxID=94130 RepID=A0A8H3QNX7_9GLOM|nr:class I SAM-dependent methyltransferase [Rhizophagus clarus]
MGNYKFTKKWFERHIPRWEKTLDGLKKKNEKISVLEIGVFEGRAAVWVLDELFKNPESKLITIDTFKNIFVNNDYESTFRKNIKESGKENQVEIIKKGIVLSWNLLKEGGIMILDNYEWDYFEEEFNNPRIAIDSFLKIYQGRIKNLIKDVRDHV